MWKHVIWADYSKRGEAAWLDVEYFVQRFEMQLELSNNDYHLLYEEFVDYQTLYEIPDFALNKDNEEERLDIVWSFLYNMKSPVGNNFRFRKLFSVAGLVLLIPHSNAGCQ